MDRRSVLVIGAAVLVRLALFVSFPNLPKILADRVEISTPVTSFKRLQEGLFLYKHGLSPYDGGVFHQAPLLLAFFNTLPSADFITNLVYIFADVFSAVSLTKIAASGVSTTTPYHTSTRKGMSWPPWAVAASFLFNPFTIATCIGRPTIVFTNCAILSAVASAVRGRSASAVLSLALASYLNLYPILLFPALAVLCYDSTPRSKNMGSLGGFASFLTVLFSLALVSLFYASYLITSFSWEFLASTYGVHLMLPDLTPNVGLWWYFFTEMFDSFRAFFLCLFQLHLLIYVPGLCLRLRSQPLFVITTLLGICSIYKSYPSIGDSALYFALLSLYRHVFPLMRYGFVVTATLLYAAFLGPAFYYLWIYAGSGNANFFYAITLVWCFDNTFLVADALFAVLRDEWETERPEVRGKDIAQM